MTENKSGNFSTEKLLKLLEDADLSESKKMWFERLIKFAHHTKNQALKNSIGDYLILKRSSTYDFLKPKEDQSEINFYLHSHVALYGPPGCGKTMLLMDTCSKIANDLAESDTVQIFVDLEGDISRILPSLVEPGKVLVFTKNTNRKNPLENAEINDQWLGLWPKPYTQAVYIGDSGHFILTKAGIRLADPELVTKMGGHATTYEISEEIPQIDDADLKQYLPVTHYRYDAFNHALGPIFNHRRGYFPRQLKNRVLVFDYSWLDPMSQILMVLYELEDALFKARHRVYGGKVIFYLEESHRIYRSVLTRPTHLFEPTPLEAYRSSRKLGFGFVMVTTDHSIHNSPDDVLDTSDTKIIFRHTDREDLKLIERALNLKREITPYISTLKNRDCLRMISGQMSEPEFHTIPDIPFKEFSIEEVEEMMEPFIRELRYVPVEKPSQPKAVSPRHLVFLERNPKRVRSYLEQLIQHKTKPIGVFAKKLPFVVDEKFAKSVAECGFTLFPKKLNFGRKGAGRGLSRVYTEITPSGARFLDVDYEEARLPPGKNKTMQSRVAVNLIHENRIKHGSKAAFEHQSADVVEWVRDLTFMYEYETSVLPHIIENVTRNLHNAAAKVYVVLDTEAQCKAARGLLKEHLSEADYRKVAVQKMETYL